MNEVCEVSAEFLEFDSVVFQTGDECLGSGELFVEFRFATLPLLLLAFQTYEMFRSLIEGLLESFVLLLTLFLELQGTVELGVQSIEIRLQCQYILFQLALPLLASLQLSILIQVQGPLRGKLFLHFPLLVLQSHLHLLQSFTDLLVFLCPLFRQGQFKFLPSQLVVVPRGSQQRADLPNRQRMHTLESEESTLV